LQMDTFVQLNKPQKHTETISGQFMMSDE